MRWLNFVTLLIYLSVLMASPVKAVVASKVDVLHSGAFSQKALIAFSHEATFSEKSQTSGDTPAYLAQLRIPTTVATAVVVIEPVNHSVSVIAIHQARAPPLS
jgi:hypothetical protein